MKRLEKRIKSKRKFDMRSDLKVTKFQLECIRIRFCFYPRGMLITECSMHIKISKLNVFVFTFQEISFRFPSNSIWTFGFSYGVRSENTDLIGKESLRRHMRFPYFCLVWFICVSEILMWDYLASFHLWCGIIMRRIMHVHWIGKGTDFYFVCVYLTKSHLRYFRFSFAQYEEITLLTLLQNERDENGSYSP